MIIKKPAILIYTMCPDAEFLKEICAGIEEETVLFTQVGKDTRDVDTLAWQAANESMLGVGIGIYKQSIALQMRGIKQGLNIQSYYMPTYIQCRNLGANSGKLVKKQGLK